MNWTRIEIVIAAALASGGCVEDTHRRGIVDHVDHVSPAVPRDVYTVTGDGQVTFYWSPPGDADLAGYHVFISRDDVDYYAIADVAVSQRHLIIRGNLLPSNVPFDFVNGNTYFFGVEAFDTAGNTSELTDAAIGFDTPRPAGRSLRLYSIEGPRFDASGYDFSRSPYGYPIDGNSLFADVYFTKANGIPTVRATHPQVVEVQDKGLLDLDDSRVGYLFEDEWIPSFEVVAGLGHVYLVKIFEETRPGNDVEPFNVAKFQVVAIEPGSVVLDWAYQIAPNNRELKPSCPHVGTTPSVRRFAEVRP